MNQIKSGSLPKDVSDRYDIIPGIGIGPIVFKGQNYDLTKITVDDAKQLSESGGVLVEKKSSAPAAKS